MVVSSEDLKVRGAVSKESLDVIVGALEGLQLFHEDGLHLTGGQESVVGVCAAWSSFWWSLIVVWMQEGEPVGPWPKSSQWVSAWFLPFLQLLYLLLQCLCPLSHLFVQNVGLL